MKNAFPISLVFIIAACSAQTNLSPSLPQTGVSAQNSSRIMETFKGYYLQASTDSLKRAEMGMQVRSLLGKTYDNRNSAARNYLFYTNQSQSYATATGPIRLGKDSTLYFESLEISQGSTHRVYYRLGKYNPLPPLPSEGSPIPFQLDPGVTLKMDWRGINPMDHDELHWSIPPAVQAQSLSSDLFL